ncbi:unnamed protein product [Lymnaea stagnalis]|uniref:RING-type domain-containing protein n=1 Tax=Lymnaea stagnalis TaxID=6523 RepID=A0AAV2HR16_LYMST
MDPVRLASYRCIMWYSSSSLLSFPKLSSAGFRYTRNGSVVRCDGCGKANDLEVFVQDGFMPDPGQRVFHADHCVYISEENCTDFNDHDSMSIEGGMVEGTQNLNHGCNTCFNSTDLKDTFNTGDGEEIVSVEQAQKIKIDNLKESTNGRVQVDACDVTMTGTDSKFQHGGNQTDSTIHHVSRVDMRAPPMSNNGQDDARGGHSSGASLMTDAGYVSDDSDQVFVDKGLFRFEYADIGSVKNTKTIHRSECTKNPGHFAYFPINGIKEEQIPSKCRHPEFIKFLNLLAILTVRIVISVTSRDRNRNDPALRPTPGTNERRYRTGTGFVSLTEHDDLPGQNDPLDDNHRRTWGNIKKYVKTLVKKNKELIYVETNRHLVFNDEEAANTTVEFFYDDPGQKGVKVIRGVGVIHSKIIGDHRSILVCQTSDHDLLHQLNRTREEALELAERLPRRAKEAMCKKLFIINHPHGGEKVLSYGDSVMVKYDLQKDSRGRFNMTKLNNPQQVADKDNVRKVLLYAADTCEGSSGAPIFTFKRGPPDHQGQPTLVLDVWMHNGVDKAHSLGGSVMKVCSPDDFVVQQSQDTAHQSADSDNEEGPGHQEVTSPVFKVLSHPSYPVYITYQKRMESYVSWVFSQIHSPEYLAQAGFFYAGYSDCVRCFQCGLGLRSWKAGDDVYQQHQKHRPNCPYLQAHGKPVGEHNHTEANRTAESETGNELDVTKNTTLTLLEKENSKLQEQLTCKVCHKQPIKDLFLPCGELYACTECSKLLTHCPSCNKQILATVTTYFS